METDSDNFTPSISTPLNYPSNLTTFRQTKKKLQLNPLFCSFFPLWPRNSILYFYCTLRSFFECACHMRHQLISLVVWKLRYGFKKYHLNFHLFRKTFVHIAEDLQIVMSLFTTNSCKLKEWEIFRKLCRLIITFGWFC